MSVSIVDGPAILIGYEYKLQIATDLILFPEVATLAAQVRCRVSDSLVLATLTTANGGLTRLADQLIEVVIAPAQTLTFKPGTIHMDIVRTDLTPDHHLGFSLEIPVVMPVTRGLLA